MMLQQIATSIA
jgi:serine/threonine protein phosphatase PrpC